LSFPEPVTKLIEELRKLPGVGPKSAQRLALHLILSGRPAIDGLVSSLIAVRDRIKRCSICGNLTDTDPCPLCKDPRRDGSVLCVVASPQDVAAIERSGGFKGLYHVLRGPISPMEGVGPEDVGVAELVHRVKHSNGRIKEVILALNPDVEGEATALYLSKEIKPLGVTVTRLARGLPQGAEIDYQDDVTLIRALEGRREV
jgi:recombination protein RecR